MIEDLVKNINQELFKKYGKKTNIEAIVDYMLDSALVTPISIRDYNIKRDYRKIKEQGDTRSDRKIMGEIADNYKMSREAIHRIITCFGYL